MKWFNVRNGYGFINRYFIHFFNTYSHCLVSRSHSDLFCFPQEWYQGRCVCSSGKARPKFGDSWLVLVTFVVFFPQTAIKKNNPRKFLRSVGDGEVVEFDVIEAVKVSTSNLNLFKKKKKRAWKIFFPPYRSIKCNIKFEKTSTWKMTSTARKGMTKRSNEMEKTSFGEKWNDKNDKEKRRQEWVVWLTDLSNFFLQLAKSLRFI